MRYLIRVKYHIEILSCDIWINWKHLLLLSSSSNSLFCLFFHTDLSELLPTLLEFSKAEVKEPVGVVSIVNILNGGHVHVEHIWVIYICVFFLFFAPI